MRKESIMSFIGHVKYKLFINFDEKIISKIRNKFLKNKNFTIISNNCWGGWVYRRLKRVNWENIIIKFNDQNGCTIENINEFNKVKEYKKMICY